MGVLEKEIQLVVTKHDILRPKFPAIDAHTHFGKMLGNMTNSGNGYFDLYETRDTVEKIKQYGIEKVVNLDGGWGEEYLRVIDKLKDTGDFFIHFGHVDVERFEESTFENEVYQTISTHHKNGVKGLKFWKVIGLGIKDKQGNYLRPDDKRLKCIWMAAAEFHMPVLFHIGDLNAFFKAPDEKNEYVDTFLDHPEWLFTAPGLFSFQELMRMQENLLSDNSDTNFIIPHVGSYAENLSQVSIWLKKFPNMYIDIADRLSELGRQPYTARKFFTEHSNKIVFGTDLMPFDTERYPIYFRFLETYDEYFPYRTKNGIMLGDWNIYGIGLDDDVLKRIYYDNMMQLLDVK